MRRSACRLLAAAAALPAPAGEPLRRLLCSVGAATPDVAHAAASSAASATSSSAEAAPEAAPARGGPGGGSGGGRPPHVPPPPVTPADCGFPVIHDLRGGPGDPGYFANAHLADATKEAMYAAHCADPATCTAHFLAAKYRVRVQRVMAILTLKQLQRNIEAREAAAGRPPPGGGEPDGGDDGGEDGDEGGGLRYLDENQRVEMSLGAVACGTGEKASPPGVSFPRFRQLALGAAAPPSAADRAAAVGAAAERAAVAEFAARLAANAAAVGAGGPGLSGWADAEGGAAAAAAALGAAAVAGGAAPPAPARSRVTASPRRPAAGWSLVVTPLGKQKDAPFVVDPPGGGGAGAAGPGGRRAPGPAEALLLSRRVPKPRRRLA